MKNKEKTCVYIVYKTDAHHSTATRDLVSIFTNLNEAVRCCQHEAKQENEPLTKYDKKMLLEQFQTQRGEENFLIENHTLNNYFI